MVTHERSLAPDMSYMFYVNISNEDITDGSTVIIRIWSQKERQKVNHVGVLFSYFSLGLDYMKVMHLD